MSETHEAVGSTPTDRAISDSDYEKLLKYLREQNPDAIIVEVKPRAA